LALELSAHIFIRRNDSEIFVRVSPPQKKNRFIYEYNRLRINMHLGQIIQHVICQLKRFISGQRRHEVAAFKIVNQHVRHDRKLLKTRPPQIWVFWAISKKMTLFID
jgi:hypothetical protein